MQNSEQMGRINIEIKDEVHRKAKAFSAIKGITLIEYINNILEKKLTREKYG